MACVCIGACCIDLKTLNEKVLRQLGKWKDGDEIVVPSSSTTKKSSPASAFIIGVKGERRDLNLNQAEIVLLNVHL